MSTILSSDRCWIFELLIPRQIKRPKLLKCIHRFFFHLKRSILDAHMKMRDILNMLNIPSSFIFPMCMPCAMYMTLMFKKWNILRKKLKLYGSSRISDIHSNYITCDDLRLVGLYRLVSKHVHRHCRFCRDNGRLAVFRYGDAPSFYVAIMFFTQFSGL